MPASHQAEAVKRVERANRRLARAGVTEQFTMHFETFVHQLEGEPFGVSAVRMTLNAPKLSLSGWSFAAAHELTADGHIISYGSARIDEMRCDHCGHARRRGKVYTVVNVDGEVAVVGSNCLAAFLGVRPEGLWALTFGLDEESEDDEGSVWGRAVTDVTVPAVDLIGAALAASSDGVRFVPKARASREEPSTASLVSKNLRTLVHAGQEPERAATAKAILDWVNAQPDGDSDYIDNLRAVLAGEDRWVGRKHFGIGVSVVAAYRNATERAAAEPLYEQGHVGEVGVRFRDRQMTVKVIRVSAGGDYGPSTRMVFRDDETGRQVIWWASGDRGDQFDEGDRVAVTATVKEHGEFNTTDQTVISRAKLTPVEGA